MAGIKKLIVVGGGPGGYVAAIAAAQAGAEVHLIEREHLGGTCLNVGCIPTKVLLHSALIYEDIASGSVAGVTAVGLRFDIAELLRHKEQIVKSLVGGVGGLLRANGVHLHTGNATIKSASAVTIDADGSTDTVEGDAIIISTGSVPAVIPFPGHDLPQVMDSTGALAPEAVPESLLIVGGGVIGVEFASFYNAIGTKVTIVEMLDEILPPVDKDVAALMRRILTDKGVGILTGAKLQSVEAEGDAVTVQVETSEGATRIAVEKVLVAVGRKPNTDGLGLESVGVQTERGAIVVDENFETSAKGIYAIGDCNAKIMLAHAASAQGEAVVSHILTGMHHYNGKVIPSCVYTFPEIASVGITEQEAKARDLDYRCGVFSLSGNGKAKIGGDNGGFIKIIADAEFGEVLGAHLIGPGVTEMIGEPAMVMSMEGTVDDIIRTIHAHPTVSEAIGEAAMSVFGNAIHWPPGR
jgi:dihydrolipoamide dehydrogenase